MIEALSRSDYPAICRGLGNVLEGVTLELFPEVGRLKERIRRFGADGVLMFKALVAKMEQVETARCFIAMLYLAMKGRIELDQQEDSDDVKMIYVKQQQQQ